MLYIIVRQVPLLLLLGIICPTFRNPPATSGNLHTLDAPALTASALEKSLLSSLACRQRLRSWLRVPDRGKGGNGKSRECRTRIRKPGLSRWVSWCLLLPKGIVVRSASPGFAPSLLGLTIGTEMPSSNRYSHCRKKAAVYHFHEHGKMLSLEMSPSQSHLEDFQPQFDALDNSTRHHACDLRQK